jgi:hypothetical protein
MYKLDTCPSLESRAVIGHKEQNLQGRITKAMPDPKPSPSPGERSHTSYNPKDTTTEDRALRDMGIAKDGGSAAGDKGSQDKGGEDTGKDE